MSKKFKNCVLIINIILIFIKIYFLIFIKKNNNKKFLKYINNFRKKSLYEFKNSDNFILDLINKNYTSISNYLNNKYNYLKYRLKKENFLSIINFLFTKRRKKIVLYYVDFCCIIHKLWLKNLLKDKYIIKFYKNKPDYLIYDVFGSEHLNPKYNNSIKIAILTENKIPDFNEADYAIGRPHINYLDRYFKFYSYFLLANLNSYDYYHSRIEVINSFKRKKFCSAVISNNYFTDGFRIKFINELSKYKTVDMGGGYNNTIGEKVKNKTEFFSSYKFSIAMENTEGDGYVSEKIVDSFLSGTIPIYYGDYMVDEYINPKSFILIKGEKDMLEKIEYIKKIDSDDYLYKTILSEKILLYNNIKHVNENELKQFLYNIFDQNKTKAYRKFY